MTLCVRRAFFHTAWRNGLSHQTRATHTRPSLSLVKDVASKLAESQPCFALRAVDIKPLAKPDVFYDTLLNMIRNARHRIFLSSLYIGEHEDELIDTLNTAMSSNSSLKLHMNLDLNRTTRPGPHSPVNLLTPLVQRYPDRVHISLYRSPALHGLLSKVVPPRFNEGWGTWHAKIYGTDNEVLLSGANLNKSYFTNRQDRYVHFKSQKLADYCASFIETASGFSYRLAAPSISPSYELVWPGSTHPHQFHANANDRLKALQDQYRHQTPNVTDGEVLMFPIMQLGQFDVREESSFFAMLFDQLSKASGQPVVDLTSGYFGLAPEYRKLVVDSKVDVKLLCASPKANGFFGSSGISGRIPEGYTQLEQTFMRSARTAARVAPPSSKHGITLKEWEREGWTYHAKGVWVRPAPDEDPVLTLLGSTNLSNRSAELDAELSFVMLSEHEGVRRQMGEEVRALWEHAVPWKGQERKVRLGTKALVGLVGSML